MKRYLVAWKKYNTYDHELEDVLAINEDEKNALSLVSHIISDVKHELVSVVHYDFERNVSIVLKPKLDENLKLCLVEEIK